MPLLSIDYINLVVKAFEERRNNGQLSQLLMHPTTANIKRACLNVYLDRKRKGEEENNILESCFGVPPVGKDFSYVIDRRANDKFKPLQRLINGRIRFPNLVTVELMAWLIDFEPRPLTKAQQNLETPNRITESDTAVAASTAVQPPASDAAIALKVTKAAAADSFSADILQISQDAENSSRVTTTGTNPWHRKLTIFVATAFLAAMLFGGMYTFWRSIALTATSPEVSTVESHCPAITKKGIACKRKTKNNNYCWQHGGR